MRDLVVQIIVTNEQNDVLVCKRGPGSRFAKNKWNLPGGHLEMDESLEDCAVRECYEETGVQIDKDSLIFLNINSDPKDNPRQKVSVAYYTNVTGKPEITVDGYEIIEGQWSNSIDNLDWAFEAQKKLVKDIINEEIGKRS